MLSSWFLSALLVALSVGLVGFINKVIVEKGYSQPMSMVVFYTVQVITYALAFLLIGNYNIVLPMVVLGVLWGVGDYINFRLRFISLQGISSSLFFINSRLFSAIALLILGVVFFGDMISIYEYIGFAIGFAVLGLLFEKEKVENPNYRKGLIALSASIFVLILLHFGIKYATTILDNIFVLFFSFAFTGLTISVITNKRQLALHTENLSKIIYLNIVHAFLFFFYIYFLFNTYKLADLGIAYKMQSYSIFVPIILSIIVYKEKVGYKKVLAFVLTIVSLWFFV